MCRFQSSWAIDWRDCITGFHCKIESNVKTSDVFDVVFMVFMFFFFLSNPSVTDNAENTHKIDGS